MFVSVFICRLRTSLVSVRNLQHPSVTASVVSSSINPHCRHYSAATNTSTTPSYDASAILSPAVMFLIHSEHLDPASIRGTGKAGRILKYDVIQAIKAGTAQKMSYTQTETKETATATKGPQTAMSTVSTSGRRSRVILPLDHQKTSSVPSSPSSATSSAPSSSLSSSSSASWYQRGGDRRDRKWAFAQH